ncbi:MAG: UDP-3-O-(3-hydroxymyristoyl)glucosamine N-acyltransferase [Muribaculaceae bacterium]
MEITAAQLAAMVQGEVVGNPEAKINNFAKIEEGREGCLSFLANQKYTHYIYSTQSSVVLVRKDFVPEEAVSATLVKVDDPYATIATLLNFVNAQIPAKQGRENPCYITEGASVPDSCYVGAFAYVGANARVGEHTQIYPQAYIGDDVVIGDNVIIYSGVKIYRGCRIGNNCIIHSGAVIGADGFGFAPVNGEYEKIAQIGNVVLEDNVEVGANTTIDRATMGSTIIRRGVKLDNLIQVAHNVEIGENTVMAAQVGVAGSTKIGKHNMVGGQVGFAGHIHIGDNCNFGAQSGVPNSVGDGKTLLGTPAIDYREFAKMFVYSKNLAALNKQVAELKKKLEENK